MHFPALLVVLLRVRPSEALFVKEHFAVARGAEQIDARVAIHRKMNIQGLRVK